MAHLVVNATSDVTLIIEFLLRTSRVDRSRLPVIIDRCCQIALVKTHQMGHNPGLVAQN